MTLSIFFQIQFSNQYLLGLKIKYHYCVLTVNILCLCDYINIYIIIMTSFIIFFVLSIEYKGIYYADVLISFTLLYTGHNNIGKLLSFRKLYIL